MQLVNRSRNASGIRVGMPLSDNQIRIVAPLTFARATYRSRPTRYIYISATNALNGLHREGFQLFVVCQTRVRNEEKREHIKYMTHLHHADQIAGREASKIILLNNHDGTSSYQMLVGMFRSAYSNDMVYGEITSDIRVCHSGDVAGDVIEGAFKVPDSSEKATTQCETMQVLTLNQGERAALARAALALKYDDQDNGAVPVTESQILASCRFEDRRNDMWTTSSRVQENMVKGGLYSRSRSGRTTMTRPASGIDQSVKLNRALWVLTEEVCRLKG